MNDNSNQKARAHNTVVGIMTIACLGTIAGSISLGWEFWVPPLIVCGMVAAWFMHFTQYGSWTFRENYYLILSMFLSFYHGVHLTSTFEIVVVSALVMVNVTLFKRKEFITIMLVECICLFVLQMIMGFRTGMLTPDILTVSKLTLHILCEFCIYKGLYDAIKNNRMDSGELELRNKEKETERAQLEDFLVNISHELRTPVNVVNGMSSMILKKENRDDIKTIRDAGLRLSRQIEDIQDYSEIQRGEVILEEDKYMITSLLNDIITNFEVTEEKNPSGLKYVYRIDPKAFYEEGTYSILLQSEDETGRQNSSPGRFRQSVEDDFSPSWAVDRTPPTIRLAGVDTERERFVTDSVPVSLIPSDNLELGELCVRILDDRGRVLREEKLGKEALRAVLDRNRGEVPVKVEAAREWQTLEAYVTDGAGLRSIGMLTDTAAGGGETLQGYRLLVSASPIVHLYRSGFLPALAFLALIGTIGFTKIL